MFMRKASSAHYFRVQSEREWTLVRKNSLGIPLPHPFSLNISLNLVRCGCDHNLYYPECAAEQSARGSAGGGIHPTCGDSGVS